MLAGLFSVTGMILLGILSSFFYKKAKKRIRDCGNSLGCLTKP